MLRKKKTNSIINLCFLVYLFGSAISFMIDNFNNGSFSLYGIETANTLQIISILLLMLLFSFFTVLINNIFIILLFIGIKFGIKSAKKDKLDDIDFGKYKEYYRDIIKDCSPAVLSYIDDFEIDSNKDIIATLLSLKLKKYIDINETQTKIQILNNDNQDNLDENEKYILSNILNNKIDTCNLLVFKEKVIADAIESNLIEVKSDAKKKIVKKVMVLIVIFVLFQILLFGMVGIINIDNNPLIIILIFILGISITMYPIFSIIYLLSYISKSKMIPYIRTKKGSEINEMLEGLKNYIKDYSLLNERSAEELTLWDEYLIYSVLFGENKTIIENFENSKRL